MQRSAGCRPITFIQPRGPYFTQGMGGVDKVGLGRKGYRAKRRNPVCAVKSVNRHSTVTHYQHPNMTHPQEGGTGGKVSEILFFSAKSKRHPSLIYSMQIIPVCLSIVARRKGVSATRRGGLYWTPISLLVGHPCKLFHNQKHGLTQCWMQNCAASSTFTCFHSAC